MSFFEHDSPLTKRRTSTLDLRHLRSIIPSIAIFQIGSKPTTGSGFQSLRPNTRQPKRIVKATPTAASSSHRSLRTKIFRPLGKVSKLIRTPCSSIRRCWQSPEPEISGPDPASVQYMSDRGWKYGMNSRLNLVLKDDVDYGDVVEAEVRRIGKQSDIGIREIGWKGEVKMDEDRKEMRDSVASFSFPPSDVFDFGIQQMSFR